ncbi:MAG: ERCC4 domain-containing protein [Actinobacteria bacterium]|nr:ERCC4 domain-containing protein [Actinomycetota bacterium]
MEATTTFVVARNPDPDSALPYLLRLPLEGGVVLKAREPWPATSRVYCHPSEWPTDAEVIEEVPVRLCRRRGSAIDLVLDRARNNRAQFVFTEVRARPAIFWQTPKVARGARPAVRVPSRRASGLEGLAVLVDTRERYPFRFAAHAEVRTERAALPAGDYAVADASGIVASVERKALTNFIHDLVDGSLGFQMGELAGFRAAAVVVEGRYSDLFKAERVTPGWLPELLARLQVRYPEVPVVFAETRKLAEEWTYRFLAAALRELSGEGED